MKGRCATTTLSKMELKIPLIMNISAAVIMPDVILMNVFM